jgi:hypothetical protein
MPAVALPVIGGAILNGIFQNHQNQQNQQNANQAQQNAQQFDAQQEQQAFANLQQQRLTALNALSQYQQQNPNPAAGWGPIIQPGNTAPQTIGGGLVGANGSMQQMPTASGLTGNPNQPAMNYQLLQALISAWSPQRQPTPQPPRTVAPTGPGGVGIPPPWNPGTGFSGTPPRPTPTRFEAL